MGVMAKVWLTSRENAIIVRDKDRLKVYSFEEKTDPAESFKKLRFRVSMLPKIVGFSF